MYSLDWWLDRLQHVRRSSSGWTALCPAHEDREPSLSLTQTPDGEVLVHCFAGCEFSDIVNSLENIPKPKITIQATSQIVARDWWEDYTQIPSGTWEEWGVIFQNNRIIFSWSDQDVAKIRSAGSKDFFWEGSPKPPLWPEIPEVLPEKIFLTEGESDFGVLKNLNLPTWALTIGSLTDLSRIWGILRDRGVSVVYLAFDDDKAGHTAAQAISDSIAGSGITSFSLPIRMIVDPLRGEKDLRDVWIRVRDREVMGSAIDDLIDRSEVNRSSRSQVSVDELLGRPVASENWLIKDVWLRGNVGLVVGVPKLGKSLLTLDLGISLATGSKFFGEFDVPLTGAVAIIQKEDTDAALIDRASKILISKGLGGTVNRRHSSVSVRFPPTSSVPLYFDLGREFIFDPPHTEVLIDWLNRIQDESGRPVDLVIIDPILKCLPPGIDEYKASQVGSSVFESAARIQSLVGSAVMMVHHRSKGRLEGRDSLGSVMFFAGAESSLFLQGDVPEGDGFIPVQGVYKNSGDRSWRYRFDSLDPDYKVSVDRTVQATITTTDEFSQTILRLLRSEPRGLTIRDICTSTELTDNIVRSILRRLQQSGIVTHSVDLTVTSSGKKPDLWRCTNIEASE